MTIFRNRWDFELIAVSFTGVSRFDDFQRQLGISRKVLTGRLQVMVAEGILERRLYQHRPDRYEYLLTDAGRDLLPVFDAMTTWSAHWRPEVGAR